MLWGIKILILQFKYIILNKKGLCFEIFFLYYKLVNQEILINHPLCLRVRSGLIKCYFISLPLFFTTYSFWYNPRNFSFFLSSYKIQFWNSSILLRQYFPHLVRNSELSKRSGSQREGKTIPHLFRFKTEYVLLCCLILK